MIGKSREMLWRDYSKKQSFSDSASLIWSDLWVGRTLLNSFEPIYHRHRSYWRPLRTGIKGEGSETSSTSTFFEVRGSTKDIWGEYRGVWEKCKRSTKFELFLYFFRTLLVFSLYSPCISLILPRTPLSKESRMKYTRLKSRFFPLDGNTLMQRASPQLRVSQKYRML